MKLDVTKSIRTFTLTFSEEEAGVLMGIAGGVTGLPWGGASVPKVCKDLYQHLRNENVKIIGHFKDTSPVYLLTDPKSGVDHTGPAWNEDDWLEDADDD